VFAPPLFSERPRNQQVIMGGVVPAVLGSITGVVLGVSAGGYWALQALAAVGGVLAGFEHRDGWGGADRGLVGGALFGTFILVAHAIAGTDAQVPLPGFPPVLAVFIAIIGMFLGALGGRLGRAARERRTVSARSEPARKPGKSRAAAS
jgi:ABC-type Na+ efflux pump permease subunit